MESIGRVLRFLIVSVQMEPKETVATRMKEVTHPASSACVHSHTYVHIQGQAREGAGNSHLLHQRFPVRLFNQEKTAPELLGSLLNIPTETKLIIRKKNGKMLCIFSFLYCI